jgi:hypothetical protein
MVQAGKTVEEFIYDTAKKRVKVKGIELKLKKPHGRPEAKIEYVVCRLEKFWNSLPCRFKNLKPFLCLNRLTILQAA